ncbi:unnamed protein product [Meganyctiphanes norvegica]|uniref:Protein sleepless n=1 Tax=Meganyctiphanes norvegica TaxID=48144 RepID=A0AAV2SDE2_MEGNR
MDQLAFILLVALTTASVQPTNGYVTCYQCYEDPTESDSDWYDPLCGAYDYHGLWTSVGDSYWIGCHIKIYDNGYVRRGGVEGDFPTELCSYDSDSTSCFFKGSFSNTGSYCEECGYPKPTPGTTTSDPATTLRCYHCIDCGTVEEGTTPIIEDNFPSCSTILLLGSNEVIRGGSYDAHPDGECATTTDSVQCWCNGDLCNKNTIGV